MAQQSSTTTTSSGTVAQSVREARADSPSASREELTLLLEQSLRRASDAALKPADRTQAQAEVATIRRRLEQGDFQPGDRFYLTVVADTVRRHDMVVRDDQTLEFGALPTLSIKGVLQSELEQAIRQHFGRFFRAPEVRVQFLTRVSVTGAVARPGSYFVPPFLLVADVVTQAAGGLSPAANPDKIRILRDRRELISEKAYREAVKAGLSIERLGIQSGDEIHVGERARRNWLQAATIAMLGLSAFTAALALIRSSYSD